MENINTIFFEGNDNYLDLDINYCDMCDNKDVSSFNISNGYIFCSECGNCINIKDKQEQEPLFVTKIKYERKEYIERQKDSEHIDLDIFWIIVAVLAFLLFCVILEFSK